MSQGTAEPASETGDDSLSAITFDSDSDTKAKKKSFHKPPPTSLKSPYHSKPRKVASWRSLRTAASMPLGGRMSLTPQKLCLGSSKQGYVPGNPVYREKEDMYDEIIELKKVINGLKQRVLKLEQQCKEKDNIINKLQTDVKTTNLEEMRIAMETYYEEIHRLHGLLASSEMTGKRPPVEKKIGLKRQKKMSSALLSLSRSVQELTEENQSLKEDLDRMLSNSPTASKIKGYTDWSKPRLVRRIAELEKKLSSMESPKPQASEAARSTSLTPSASSPTLHLQENERLHGAVKSLKGERSALHTQLQERDLEVKQLLQTKAELEKELESMKEGERERREREKALREEVQTLTRKFQELEGSKKDEEDEPVAAAPQTHEEPSQPPSPTASPSKPDAEPDWNQGGSSWPPSTCSEGRRDEAARVLQRRWKGYQRQKERALLDEHPLSTLVRTSVLRPRAEGPRSTDRKAGQSRLEGGYRAAGGFPGASSSGEAVVQGSLCLRTPQGAEPSHPGLARAPHPEPCCPGRGRPVARGGRHHHPVCLPGTPGTGQAQRPRSRGQYCCGSRQAGPATPQGPLLSTLPCGRSRAGRQRGEQQGDRQGASSRGRSAEAATLLRRAPRLGTAAHGTRTRGGCELRRLRRDRPSTVSAHEEERLPALGPGLACMP
ncbi:IQ domain-containing protein E isoform X14 [Bos indicus x Bos taurus]|uniref:IQ domain-containing protein E isoform X14 n=1 Tax=Bos indicus x Bos taurus TaxID=30522 RepID=UPI000F7D25EB|nr:IQ domain-containing protein E isoform X14 [Bos indicus x Bos taurus]